MNAINMFNTICSIIDSEKNNIGVEKVFQHVDFANEQIDNTAIFLEISDLNTDNYELIYKTLNINAYIFVKLTDYQETRNLLFDIAEKLENVFRTNENLKYFLPLINLELNYAIINNVKFMVGNMLIKLNLIQ